MKSQKRILSLIMTGCLSISAMSVSVGAADLDHRAPTSSCIKSSTYPENPNVNNTSDEYFTLCAESRERYTNTRNKYHDKGIYVKLSEIYDSNSSSSIRVSTALASKFNLSNKTGCDDGGWSNGYNQHYRYISKNVDYILNNYVLEASRRDQYTNYGYGNYGLEKTYSYAGYECWYTHAALRFKFSSASDSSHNYHVCGKWSPDSVWYSYTTVTWGNWE